MVFERKKEKLAPRHVFYKRFARGTFIAFLIVCVSLAIGMSGYHYFESMNWIDAFANAAMILSGMGPLKPLETDHGKLFAGFYALYSGLAVILIIGVILAPVVHRFFHKFHLDLKKK